MCGIASTWCCSTEWVRPTRSTGRAPAWTAPASRPKGGGPDQEVGPNPTDRGKSGSKRHVGYDFPRCRAYLHRRGIVCRIARRGIESNEKLGRYRWVVERAFAWLNHFRRLTIRYERLADIHLAFLDLGCALTCLRFLQHGF
jgi:Transposase DDE domain